MRTDDGVALAVETVGEGPPVLLVHGFPDSGRVWRHQVGALAAAGHRVIVPDLRGFGASDRPEGVEHYGGMRIVADLLMTAGVGLFGAFSGFVEASTAWM